MENNARIMTDIRRQVIGDDDYEFGLPLSSVGTHIGRLKTLNNPVGAVLLVLPVWKDYVYSRETRNNWQRSQ